jgi:hypothetical protein
MKLLSSQYGDNKRADIYHTETCYVVEFYIDGRLYNRVNVNEALVDAKQLVETFLGKSNQVLLNEHGQ